MSKKVNKIEEQELETVKKQTGKIQQCILDLGSLEVKKTEIMQAYSEFLKELDVTKKDIQKQIDKIYLSKFE